MEVFVGRFGLPVFRAGPIITALLAIVLSACSGDPGPSADSEQAAAEAKQMLASGGSADGKALYASFPEFKKLEAPHARVHESGIEALKASEKGDSQTLINTLQIMEDASVDVFECLNALKARITQM